MKLSDSKEVSTPGVEDEGSSEADDKEPDPSRTSRYKSVVARANYLAHDRPEIQYATKECARKMSKPTEKDWQKLKRLARFLKGHQRTTLHYEWQNPVDQVTAHTNAKWAAEESIESRQAGEQYSLAVT